MQASFQKSRFKEKRGSDSEWRGAAPKRSSGVGEIHGALGADAPAQNHPVVQIIKNLQPDGRTTRRLAPKEFRRHIVHEYG